MKCKNCGSDVMASAELCGCGWHLITNEMTPTTPANAETRARFLDGVKRTQQFQKRMLAIGAGSLAAIVIITVILFWTLGEAAFMVPIFAAVIGFRVYRILLYREMRARTP